jgi:glutamate-ammonia-ligase adenylyltransferase
LRAWNVQERLAQAGELPDFATLEAHVRESETAVRASFGRVLGKVGGKAAKVR